MTHLPVEDPYDRGSLAERSRHYVRASLALRIAFLATAVDHIAAVLLVVIGRVAPEVAGAFAFFSVLTWFFAVCMPVMHRSVRACLGVAETGYWSEVVEMFGRVVLCCATALYTAAIIYGAAHPIGT